MLTPENPFAQLHGALLIHKPAGITSFGVIETLEKQLRARFGIKRKELPKMGHGGTLDPFATGLLVVCVGNGVKLSRYLLGSEKTYEGTLLFGQTTASGDPTNPVTETSSVLPGSLEELQKVADEWCTAPYAQIPPMHSAKKKNGVALYELARQGIEIEREAKICQLSDFRILDFKRVSQAGQPGQPRVKNSESNGATSFDCTPGLSQGDAVEARFRVNCTSGTYIRVVAQDFGKKLGTAAMLTTLHRVASGAFKIENAFTLEQFTAAAAVDRSDLSANWENLPCFVSFDRMLGGYRSVIATAEEKLGLIQGKQKTLMPLVKRAGMSLEPAATRPASSTDTDLDKQNCLMIYESEKLIAVGRRTATGWEIERVFT